MNNHSSDVSNYKPEFLSYLRELKPWLDEIGYHIEHGDYIRHDPVQFLHRYTHKENNLLAGFFGALMAWGRRDIVIRKVDELLQLMDDQPADFIYNFSPDQFGRFQQFKHRTFKPVDIYWLMMILKRILWKYDGFAEFWRQCYRQSQREEEHFLSTFQREFTAIAPDMADRTNKHIATPEKNSSCKRLCLYLKWTNRPGSPVDTNLLGFLPPSEIPIPLDVHVARYARELGLLHRSYNDWKSVAMLTGVLKQMAPEDPSWYDFALFGLGISELSIPDKIHQKAILFRENGILEN